MNNLNWNKVYLKMKCCVYFIFGNENSTQTMMRMMHAKSYYNNDVRFLCYIFIWYASKSMNSILNNANSFLLLCLHNSCEIDLYMHGVLLILYDKVCAWVHLYGLLKIDSGLNSTYTTFLYTHWTFQTPWGIQ